MLAFVVLALLVFAPFVPVRVRVPVAFLVAMLFPVLVRAVLAAGFGRVKLGLGWVTFGIDMDESGQPQPWVYFGLLKAFLYC